MKWYRSVAVKSFLIAFVATHVPLLALLALVTLHPAWLTPVGVLLAALVATLLATAVLITVLWRLFRPLRQAADGLLGFMTRGAPVQMGVGAQDEIGRLVGLLVQSLAHLDRGKAPLLRSGATALAASAGPGGGRVLRCMALVELVQWDALDAAGDVIRMAKLQNALQRQISDALSPAETVLPWGRGRVLALLEGTEAEALNRLQRSCAHLALPADQESYRTRMVIDARDSAGQQGWANAMQRLEQRLFEARLAEPGDQRPAAA